MTATSETMPARIGADANARKGLSALGVTGCLLVTQMLAALSQVIIAKRFGAGTIVDAYFAGLTVPQYLVTVVSGSFVFVVVPVLVDHLHHDPPAASRTMSGVLALGLCVLGVAAVGGILLSGVVTAVMFPGFDATTHNLAVWVSIVTWPTVIAAALSSLLIGAHQAMGQFVWSAAAPAIGAAVNILVMLALSGLLGVVGVAVSGTVGAILTMVLLARLPGLTTWPSLRAIWQEPGVRQVAALTWPLLLSALLIRSTPLIDRHLAAALSTGALAHLGYASRLLALIAMLVSSGIAAVVYPAMALDAASTDQQRFSGNLAKALQLIWLLTAPAIFIGQVLTPDTIQLVMVGGAFDAGAAASVSSILQIYFLALGGMCLGNVTGRAFYATKNTRLPALIGIIEVLAYYFYTRYLADTYGIIGVAAALVIYYTASVVWQLAALQHWCGARGLVRSFAGPFARTLMCALAAAAVVFALLAATDAPPAANVFLGGTVGVLCYGGLMALFSRSELNAFVEFHFGRRLKAQPKETA